MNSLCTSFKKMTHLLTFQSILSPTKQRRCSPKSSGNKTNSKADNKVLSTHVFRYKQNKDKIQATYRLH